MGLDRGTLSRIDRKLLSGLDRDEAWRMVRVPVSEAVWSAWKRCCSAVGVSMGRALSELIQSELASVVSSPNDLNRLPDLATELREREEFLDERERRVGERERALNERQRLASVQRQSPMATNTMKVGRNEPCPCRSGLKYKRCHGS